MLPVRKDVLVENYRLDSSMVYNCTAEELHVLRSELGELEPIIDALNVLDDATYDQRARDLGISVSDFWYEMTDEDMVIHGVVDL